ncbi:DUF2189 domain-containing protein [Rhodoplanes sp. TEM]|uniref:DUF2189 domain-containing protein n=1 Tax=Rhodoplanes tepidamans TaxID=200616 RepID=A0ABT5JJE8_RHOTP|nr:MULTISPECIES: DUF2189 domain-containing protein [Rhodoplanes]MDC7789732.1 DUF2189 domain-containing protein [Rhodoplanes tepidamans]MDC7985801.1 DUF2189 domain-containing protein [Rhodoplanes sp. TEM]MDQ0358873.1 putative membrane protein [Rhodoplanes tepidamans]
MSTLHVFAGSVEHPVRPEIRRIGLRDLRDALARGIDDFRAMPSHVIFLSLLYPIVGLVLARLSFGYDVVPLLFPLVAGFALVGPFVALGLYELSRRREQGRPAGWRDAFGVLRNPAIDSIALLGGLLMLLFVIWLAVAEGLYQSLFGYGVPESLSGFLAEVVGTAHGRTLLIAGNAIGFLFALVVLVISVVSFPMLLDRDIGAVTAMQTSVRAVARNPVAMAAWGLIVAAALALGSLPFFIGLAVVLPVLAHATWHLYRRVVV